VRTLYVRIVMIFLLITFLGVILALIVTNFYYLGHIRDSNEKKIMSIGEDIRSLYEQNPNMELGSYLTHIANLGYQIYAVDSDLNGTYYGTPFKHKQFNGEHIKHVLQGGVYNGIKQESQWLKINSLFENSLRNSVGLPVQVHGEPYALFIRPNMEQQIGEVRIILALLIGFSFLFSIILIVVLSRFIVKPIKKLTEATHRIVGGDYRMELDVTRRDEIGNLARDFTHMARSIKQLDDMRQEFVANVSHEIQSPLTSIQGFAQSILEKKTSPEEEERYMRIIEEESRRLSSLSKQLLTLATLDKEDHILKRSSFRLDEQIRQIFIVTEQQWSDRDIELDLNLTEVVVNADQQLLYQVWYNLITNAIKFTNPGGVLRVTLAAEAGLAVVRVADSGIGIPEAELAHIFDRFYKADKMRTRAQGGSGLGLSIASKVVTLHGGRIEVASRLGEGTEFTVRLPVG